MRNILINEVTHMKYFICAMVNVKNSHLSHRLQTKMGPHRKTVTCRLHREESGNMIRIICFIFLLSFTGSAWAKVRIPNPPIQVY